MESSDISGRGHATPIILNRLKRLEYRGYDSAGLAVWNGSQIEVRRDAGKLSQLIDLVGKSPLTGAPGIGHTRWATHGAPSARNAHPHLGNSARLVVVAMGFGVFLLGEYASIWSMSALAATLFLGGWRGPGADALPLLSLGWFLLKSAAFVFLFYWLRGTLPRLRQDQLMAFGWKFLLPLTLLNLLWAAGVTAWRAQP